MKNIAIFASGSGTNAENIINYFSDSLDIRVALVLTNNSKAGVINRCEKLGVECRVFSKAELSEGEAVLKMMEQESIDFVVLAGFLLMVPESIIERWKGAIVNIHPALLPSYGGAGMYGMRVHEAVIAAKESVSGITIHQVDAIYDNGETIFQAKVSIDESDTPETLAAKIHELEYKYFPGVIEEVVMTLGDSQGL